MSDALDKHHLVGAIVGIGRLSAGGGTVAGRATTVQLGTPPTDSEGPKRHLGSAAADAAGPSEVIVVANGGRTDCGSWGGLLSRGAAVRGVAGVVVDGAVRDVDEASEAGLPIFGRATTCVTARGRTAELAWGVPVEIDGIEIKPGDLVLADSNGCVVVPEAVADQVLTTAEDIADKEHSMARAIDAGSPVSVVMSGEYEEMTNGTK